MESTDKMCKVCYREIYGTEMPEEVEICGICNENQVKPGKDICSMCLKELNGERISTDEGVVVLAEEDGEAPMDEIAPEIGHADDIPEPEYQEMDKDLSLEELEEEEESDADDTDDDDE